MLELVHEHDYSRQQDALIAKYPRLKEVTDCAEWQIGEDHQRFPLVNGDSQLRVWRSDDSDIDELPTLEVAYIYFVDDGLVHLLGVRETSANDSD